MKNIKLASNLHKAFELKMMRMHVLGKKIEKSKTTCYQLITITSHSF